MLSLYETDKNLNLSLGGDEFRFFLFLTRVTADKTPPSKVSGGSTPMGKE
ncbi:MAG: hypothetical protein KKC11_00140 [Candidatus Omnitrophica bacterium]|nr:hypothetical protein [Candidatus Omnitrophota bacterium]MBU1134458.1 hypothetical protein [Candidatus Omnitrophota bacterium]MBU1524527.1 hypothetical protein [Candidatus Omnitrophota bacterium]MBU1810655.1 hypothetical protein [Candidatus Omnitrophota bacterium]